MAIYLIPKVPIAKSILIPTFRTDQKSRRRGMEEGKATSLTRRLKKIHSVQDIVVVGVREATGYGVINEIKIRPKW
jgi:hypothetical protein